MTCAACQGHVEKAVKAVEGVEGCAVSLLTNSMQVEGQVSPDKIIQAVQNAGYKASLFGADKGVTSDEDSLKDTETPKMKKRLIWSVIFLLPLMYVSMGHMMWSWPVPEFLSASHINVGIYELLFTIVVMVINKKFFTSGFKGLLHGAPNMDTLVALGSSAAFAYSTVVLFLYAYYTEVGNSEAASSYMHDLYFESAAMILTLITVGKMLESYSKGKTTDAIKSLMRLSPNTATVIRDDKELEISVKDVIKGDIFIVKPGENIPVDGIVISGSSAVNEAAITGESIPVDKEEGSRVTSATSNISGYLKCRAERVGEDTTLSQIIRLVSDASASKAPIAKTADKVAGVFVPAVMSIALITFFIWMAGAGESFGFSVSRAISVLVISCPCALGLATPVAIMVGNGKGAKNGILFKSAAAFEAMGRTQIVVLDKTGTITKGKPAVTDICPAEGISKAELLSIAAALEHKSEHPLAEAINAYAAQSNIEILESEDFKILPGSGLYGKISGRNCHGGNEKFILKAAAVPGSISAEADKLAGEGKTPLFFAADGKILGIIAVADVIKESSREAVRALKAMGIRVVMLTGDNERTANAIAKMVETDAVVAEVMPDIKERVVAALKENNQNVAMVGDGINDAPALTRADTGIAIGAGSDIAIDSADVVLMKSDLADVPAAIRLSRSVIKNIHENLFWAFAYNTVCIPVAMGALIPIWGIKLSPMIGAAAMSLSSLCVVSNALRLNIAKIYDDKKDIRLKRAASIEALKSLNLKQEEKEMKKTIKIEGMMCTHCEAHVKKALSAIENVTVESISHEADEAVVSLAAEVSDEILAAAVTEEGYKVISILQLP